MSDKLKKYVAREMDSSGIQVLLNYQKDLFLKNGTVVPKSHIKESPRTNFSVCTTQEFCS